VSKRLARLNEQLKRELSALIRKEVRDPRVGVVTITGVDTAGDLGSAKIFVRAIDDQALPEMLEGLEAAAPFLRTKLGQMLHIRTVPELRFQEDRSLEGARRIEEVLQEVLPEEDESEVPPGEEGSEVVSGGEGSEVRADEEEGERSEAGSEEG